MRGTGVPGSYGLGVPRNLNLAVKTHDGGVVQTGENQRSVVPSRNIKKRIRAERKNQRKSPIERTSLGDEGKGSLG